MSKPKKQISVPQIISNPAQILLDETFLMCASGQGCDPKEDTCKDEPARRKQRALAAMLIAQEAEVSLVLDTGEPSQVAAFYRKKEAQLSRDVAEILSEWLNKRTIRHRPARVNKINPKALKECTLRDGELDRLLCQLAIACRGDAPTWTLDSDFWCVAQFHLEIKPTCPKDALDSVR